MQEPEEAISNNVATGCEQCELPVESGTVRCIPRQWFNNRGLQGGIVFVLAAEAGDSPRRRDSPR